MGWRSAALIVILTFGVLFSFLYFGTQVNANDNNHKLLLAPHVNQENAIEMAKENITQYLENPEGFGLYNSPDYDYGTGKKFPYIPVDDFKDAGLQLGLYYVDEDGERWRRVYVEKSIGDVGYISFAKCESFMPCLPIGDDANIRGHLVWYIDMVGLCKLDEPASGGAFLFAIDAYYGEIIWLSKPVVDSQIKACNQTIVTESKLTAMDAMEIVDADLQKKPDGYTDFGVYTIDGFLRLSEIDEQVKPIQLALYYQHTNGTKIHVNSTSGQVVGSCVTSTTECLPGKPYTDYAADRLVYFMDIVIFGDEDRQSKSGFYLVDARSGEVLYSYLY